MPPAPCGLRLIQERLSSSSLRIHTVPCLRDNYAWILQDVPTGQLAVVDTPSAKPIIDKFRELGISEGRNPIILNTHHHDDHTGGNLEIKKELNAMIFGPKIDHIVGIDRCLEEGDQVHIGNSVCRVIDIPGHTHGHIGYVFDDIGVVFVGDVLFSHGSGAVFEGSFSQMWDSLTKIMELPPNYLVFCAHEYTESNVKYALHALPDDMELMEVHKQVTDLRKNNQQTVPTLLEQELKTNPFLRCRLPAYQKLIGATNAIEAFTRVRQDKDLWGRGSATK